MGLYVVALAGETSLREKQTLAREAAVALYVVALAGETSLTEKQILAAETWLRAAGDGLVALYVVALAGHFSNREADLEGDALRAGWSLRGGGDDSSNGDR